MKQSPSSSSRLSLNNQEHRTLNSSIKSIFVLKRDENEFRVDKYGSKYNYKECFLGEKETMTKYGYTCCGLDSSGDKNLDGLYSALTYRMYKNKELDELIILFPDRNGIHFQATVSNDKFRKLYGMDNQPIVNDADELAEALFKINSLSSSKFMKEEEENDDFMFDDPFEDDSLSTSQSSFAQVIPQAQHPSQFIIPRYDFLGGEYLPQYNKEIDKRNLINRIEKMQMLKSMSNSMNELKSLNLYN